MNGQMVSLALALLGAAAVYGTDIFFCVVGRTALTRVSDSALVETMGRFHEVADRRMPIFGVIGIAGALASIAFSRVSWPWALSAVAAQVLWIVVYRTVAAPCVALTSRNPGEPAKNTPIYAASRTSQFAEIVQCGEPFFGSASNSRTRRTAECTSEQDSATEH